MSRRRRIEEEIRALQREGHADRRAEQRRREKARRRAKFERKPSRP